MLRVVILGTGTGVGKTYLTAALARALTATGPHHRVAALKPIETGTPARGGGSAPARDTDAATLEAASGAPPYRPHPLYALRDGVSAHLAARRAGTRVSTDAVGAWLDSNALRDTTLPATIELIETAGGVFSPLSARRTNLDLAQRLSPAVWILVAPDSLGVLHDVRATLIAMRAVARAPDHIVLSGARVADASAGTNADELRRVGLPSPIAVISRGDATSAALEPLVRALLGPVTPERRGRSGRARA